MISDRDNSCVVTGNNKNRTWSSESTIDAITYCYILSSIQSVIDRSYKMRVLRTSLHHMESRAKKKSWHFVDESRTLSYVGQTARVTWAIFVDGQNQVMHVCNDVYKNVF